MESQYNHYAYPAAEARPYPRSLRHGARRNEIPTSVVLHVVFSVVWFVFSFLPEVPPENTLIPPFSLRSLLVSTLLSTIIDSKPDSSTPVSAASMTNPSTACILNISLSLALLGFFLLSPRFLRSAGLLSPSLHIESSSLSSFFMLRFLLLGSTPSLTPSAPVLHLVLQLTSLIGFLKILHAVDLSRNSSHRMRGSSHSCVPTLFLFLSTTLVASLASTSNLGDALRLLLLSDCYLLYVSQLVSVLLSVRASSSFTPSLSPSPSQLYLHDLCFALSVLSHVLTAILHLSLWRLVGLRFCLQDVALLLSLRGVCQDVATATNEWQTKRDTLKSWDCSACAAWANEAEVKAANQSGDVCAICLKEYSVVVVVSSVLSRLFYGGADKPSALTTTTTTATTDARKLNTCGHLFHDTCIAEVVNRAGGPEKTKCPLCRQLLLHEDKEDKDADKGAASAETRGVSRPTRGGGLLRANSAAATTTTAPRGAHPPPLSLPGVVTRSRARPERQALIAAVAELFPEIPGERVEAALWAEGDDAEAAVENL